MKYFRSILFACASLTALAALGACSGGGSAVTTLGPDALPAAGARATGGRQSTPAGAGTIGAAFTVRPAPLTVTPGFKAEIVGNVPGARELKVARNGDLLIGTEGASIALITNADGTAGAPGPTQTLITLPEGPAAGIGLGPNATMYAGTEHAVWKIHYLPGDTSEANPQKIASLRTGPVSGTDGDLHHTTSVAVVVGSVYAAVGSSCNACNEIDPGRAAILKMGLNGEQPVVYAKHVRNAMALASNPRTFFLWAGGAGQDSLPAGRPYEYFDSITQHPAGSDWGWPDCEMNDVAFTPGANCSKMIVPHVELPAYSTIIGAVFYPLAPTGPFAFPAQYRGGIFLSAHGSWHRDGAGMPIVAPQVDFVPMNSNGWDALQPVNWTNPAAQFSQFLGGFEAPGSPSFSGRPTGVAFGPLGSLFIGDDLTGNIYRIRPM